MIIARPTGGDLSDASPLDSVSVVIVAFHRPDALTTLLRALDGAVEVVVVAVEDDETIVGIARRWGAKTVPLLDNPGFAAAVNAGVSATTGSVVVYLNDDVVVRPAALAALADVVRSRGGVAVPAVCNGAGVREPTIFSLPTPLRLLTDWALLPDRPLPLPAAMRPAKWRMPTKVERIDAAAATVVASDAHVLRRFPLPENYFLYWEEAEWFWSLSRGGVPVWFQPAAECMHAGGRSDLRPEKSALMARNAVRCIRCTQGRPAAALAYVAVLVWNARLVLTTALTFGSRRSSPALRARLAGLRAAVASVREIR